MNNREISWVLLDRVVELYTPKIRQDHDDGVISSGSVVYTQCKNGVYKRSEASKEERARLLDEFRDKHTGFISAMSEMFVFLTDNFPLGELTEDETTELIAEAKEIFRGELEVESASDRCFPILFVNVALKNRRIPIVSALEWVDFAKQYTNIIMA